MQRYVLGSGLMGLKTKRYFRIYEEIYRDPTSSVYEISVKTGMSRNTVAKYLREMYDHGIMVGPHLRINPSPNYAEYFYFLNFKDPFTVFTGLKRFPHVLYHGIAFGDWNTLVVTDRLLDLSRLVGFEEVVYQGVRGFSYTPKVEWIGWEEGLGKLCKELKDFTSGTEYRERRMAPLLEWGEDEWKLFSTFRCDLRRKVTPALRKIRVRYETYARWMETLKDHCSVHVSFFPEGYSEYVHHCFLVSSEYESVVRLLFSYFPATPYFVEVGDKLLVITAIQTSEMRRLICSMYDMKVKEIIKRYNHSVGIFYCKH